MFCTFRGCVPRPDTPGQTLLARHSWPDTPGQTLQVGSLVATSSRMLLSTMTPLGLRNRPARPANTAIISSNCRGALRCGRPHDLVCAHAGVRAATERFERSADSSACAGRRSRLADAGEISCEFESDCSVRQKSQTVADLLRNGHWPFACDFDGITSVGKCNDHGLTRRQQRIIRCDSSQTPAVTVSIDLAAQAVHEKSS
jgi:hypothetical protein